MSNQQKSRKLTRALVQPYTRYFQTLDMKPPQFPAYNQASNKTVTLNPFSKKSIDKTLQAYAQDLPSRKFLERRITMKDLKNSSRRNKRNNSIDKIESVTLVRASRQNKHSREYSFVESSNSRLKYSSINKQKTTSVLDRYRRSSLSSPYKDDLEQKRRAISRTHDTVSLKPPINISTNVLELAKRLYKQNKLDEAILTLNQLTGNRKSSQSEYILGLCYMNKSHYDRATKIFEKIVKQDPTFKKNIYLLIGIAYKKQNQIDSSIKILTRGLEHFPDYFDCLVYRGKLYLKIDEPQKSLDDFEKASTICPQKGFPWIGKAEALKHLGRIQQGIQALNQALTTDARSIARLKRGELYYQNKNYKLALEDISKCLQGQQSNQALFYKGLILKKMGQCSEALMIWQQVTKDPSDDTYVEKSAQQIIKTKIQEKDFYQASFILGRLKYPMVVWRIFVEATLLLMKKKYQQGLEMYNSPELLLYTKSVSSAQKQLNNQQVRSRYEFLKPLIHLYRAYGYFCLNNLAKAMNDYKLSDQFQSSKPNKNSSINSSKEYNQCLIEAITKFHENSQPHLLKAISLYPNKSEPYLYLAMCGVQKYIIQQQPQIIQKVKSHLDKAVSYLPQLSNNHVSSVYYHRAVIYLYMNQFEASVTDIDKAIQKSEDNIPKYFYLRGLIFACCSNFTQAIQDYSVCINLDSKFGKAYIQRAKCVQMEGNITQAFNDLQKYISLNPNDPLINQYAASLLFQNCAYSDCLVALSHSKIESSENYLTKTKCHLLLGQLQKSVESFEKFMSIRSIQDSLSSDLQILKLLKQLCISPDYEQAETIMSEFINAKDYDGQLFNITDLLVIRGCIKCCNNKYQESENDFMSCLSLKQIFHKKEVMEIIQITQDNESNDVGWSIGQVYYCLSIVALAQKKYKLAYQYFLKAESDEIFRESQWAKYKSLLKGLYQNSPSILQLIKQFNKSQVDMESCNTFMTKIFQPVWIDLNNTQIKLPLILAYPQMQSPSLTPQFDHQLLIDFKASIVEPKPQAPWITRKIQGVVFTSNVQVFDNLQLSMTSVNSNQRLESHNSVLSSQSVQIIAKDKLKQRFKLDADIQSKLNKLLDKKKKQNGG